MATKFMSEGEFQELDAILHPKSIAVVGASGDLRNVGGSYFQNLVASEFEGVVYPVNVKGGKIGNYEVYQSVRDIPGGVDLAIVAVPRRFMPGILDDCQEKRVKAVHIFTGGFSESGEEEGFELEQKIKEKAKRGGFRIIGPNSLGVSCLGARLPLGVEGLLGKPGRVGLICQSGSISLELAMIGISRGIYFSKIFSFGNGLDLDAIDYFRYLASDPETDIIAMYLEGIGNGQELLDLLKEVSKEKPVLLWKGGRSEVGAEAAVSHSGMLAGSERIWDAAIIQAGAIRIGSMEELSDTLLAFQNLPSFRGGRISIISGLADGGGGASVTAADICSSAGLEIPRFSKETQEQLKVLVGQVGSILGNPLDLSQAYGNLEIIRRSIELAASVPDIDLFMIHENLYALLRYHPFDKVLDMNDMFIEISKRFKKPFVTILMTALAEDKQLSFEKELRSRGIALYPSLERAAKAVVNVSRYYNMLR
jgi:acyl-CoA synthetase (NDP forming)